VVPESEVEQAEDPDSAGSGDGAGRPATERKSDPLPAAVTQPWTRGLTPDGAARFERWSRDKMSMNEWQLYHEMERQALARRRAGEPVYTWERVEEAIEALEAAARKEIEDEVRQKIRPAVVEEVREAERQRLDDERRIRQEAAQRAELALRARRRWRWFASASLTAGATSAVALLGVEAPAWQKFTLIGAALGGAWFAGPGRDTGGDSTHPG
jgi:hypothetical protein